MAAINDLIRQIDDRALRERLTQEVDRISNNRKFGLVFEEHLPECTPIYSASINRGSIVSQKDKKVEDIYYVLALNDGIAMCLNKIDGGKTEIGIDELVVIAQFGNPIFPTLTPVDKVQNSEDDTLWHTLIEADNYHALQLLEYLYPKQVDCIYIDPPYNTGARDWKYNNNYVDSSDSWRHSKWLSMIQKRLKIAKRLLKDDGILITTIDDNEYAHLWMLLNDVFPERKHVPISIQHNPGGTQGDNFSVTHEYAIYSIAESSIVYRKKHTGGDVYNLRRWGSTSGRYEGATCFYPILLNKSHNIIGFGDVVEKEFHPTGQTVYREDDIIEVWPIDKKQIEKKWRYARDTVESVRDRMFVHANGDRLEILLRRESEPPKTIWTDALYNAEAHGTNFLKSLIGGGFSYPKSLYAVKDCLGFAVWGNKKALILDFFAGSGTTLNAVNLLNYEDSGSRRCIMVTNNEVSEDIVKKLKQNGFVNGDREWEREGICQAITWPRTKNSILGRSSDGITLDGDYFTSLQASKERPRKYTQLSFLDKKALNSTKNIKQLVSLLGKDKLPQSLVKSICKYIISDKYPVSILIDDSAKDEWLSKLEGQDHIIEFYVVTDSISLFNEIKEKLELLLGNFVILEDVKKPIGEGFKANIEYFKLDFLDKHSIELGQQFREILPILWLRAGAVGVRPELPVNAEIPNMLVPNNSNFAILVDETYSAEFSKEISTNENLTHVFIITNSEESFREIASQIKVKNITQLYRDFVDNFVINSGRF